MAFSPDSKPFKNSAFCCSVEVMGKWEPFPFSLGNYSCRNEGVGERGEDVGVRWNWGSSKMGKKRLTLDTTRAFVFTPRALRPLGEDSPIELISVFRAHIKSLLRKPSWGRREKKTTQILFCWVSHLFENEMRGCSKMLMEIFANTCLKLLPSKESLSYKYVRVI